MRFCAQHGHCRLVVSETPLSLRGVAASDGLVLWAQGRVLGSLWGGMGREQTAQAVGLVGFSLDPARSGPPGPCPPSVSARCTHAQSAWHGPPGPREHSSQPPLHKSDLLVPLPTGISPSLPPKAPCPQWAACCRPFSCSIPTTHMACFTLLMTSLWQLSRSVMLTSTPSFT